MFGNAVLRDTVEERVRKIFFISRVIWKEDIFRQSKQHFHI